MSSRIKPLEVLIAMNETTTDKDCYLVAFAANLFFFGSFASYVVASGSLAFLSPRVIYRIERAF